MGESLRRRPEAADGGVQTAARLRGPTSSQRHPQGDKLLQLQESL
jgi:hypothetical protein